jgi:ABC-type nitrate/sulfonate/bicarbonate transport system substrate-binding protein
VLIRLLNQAGLQPADVKVTLLGPDALTQVFEQGLADAVFETRHFTKTIFDQGQSRIIQTNEDIRNTIGAINATPLVANVTVIENEPEGVQGFVNGWVKALAYIQANPEDSARLLQIYFHRQGTVVPPELALSWVGFTNYDRYVWSDGDVKDAEYNGWGLVTGEVLKVQPKLGGYIDNRFAEEAVKNVFEGAGS